MSSAWPRVVECRRRRIEVAVSEGARFVFAEVHTTRDGRVCGMFAEVGTGFGMNFKMIGNVVNKLYMRKRKQ